MGTLERWGKLDKPFRFRVRVAPVATVGFILLMAWAMWNQSRLIASQQGEIKRLQEAIRHLEKRLRVVNQIRSHRPTLPLEEGRASPHVREEVEILLRCSAFDEGNIHCANCQAISGVRDKMATLILRTEKALSRTSKV